MADSLLIVKPSSLGDVVHGLSVVPVIRAYNPNIRIGWLVNEMYAPLVEAAGIDTLHIFPRQNWRRIEKMPLATWQTTRMCTQIAMRSYSVAIDLQGLFRSGFFTLVSHAPVRIGYADAREYAHTAYTQKITVDRVNMHAVDWCRAALKALMPVPEKVEWQWLNLPEKSDKVHARYGTTPDEYFLFVLRARWKTKSLSPHLLAKIIAETIAHYEKKVFMIGSKSDIAFAEKVRIALRNAGVPDSSFSSLAGLTSLTDLIPLCRDSICVISPDTGVMHLAVAADARVIAIMGPTRTDTHGPYGFRDNVVRSQCDCTPCYSKICARAPRGAECAECMESIHPDEVVKMITATCASVAYTRKV